MSAVEPLCRLMGIEPSQLSREEYYILEAELFYNICEELKEIFKVRHKEYFHLFKFTTEKEAQMLDQNFLRFFINDILLTEEYTFEGFANYVNAHTDVIHEVMAGRNTNPSAALLQKTIGLHRLLNRDLYKIIMQRIIQKYLIQ